MGIDARAEAVMEKVSSLRHHPDNPRVGDVAAIVESIKENGWFGVVVAQKSTKYVLAGNHRLKAARKLKIKDVPVVWVDVDDERARKILLADNRISDRAKYNDKALFDMLEEIGREELVGTGWDEADFDRLLEKVNPNKPPPKLPKERKQNVSGAYEGKRHVVCPNCSFKIDATSHAWLKQMAEAENDKD